MELKVSKEIKGKWQNQRPETNKYVSWALFWKLQAAGINFEKLLGSFALLWHLLFLLCYFNLPLKF